MSSDRNPLDQAIVTLVVLLILMAIACLVLAPKHRVESAYRFWTEAAR